jgi:hypothetical protein
MALIRHAIWHWIGVSAALSQRSAGTTNRRAQPDANPRRGRGSSRAPGVSQRGSVGTVALQVVQQRRPELAVGRRDRVRIIRCNGLGDGFTYRWDRPAPTHDVVDGPDQAAAVEHRQQPHPLSGHQFRHLIDGVISSVRAPRT